MAKKQAPAQSEEVAAPAAEEVQPAEAPAGAPVEPETPAAPPVTEDIEVTDEHRSRIASASTESLRTILARGELPPSLAALMEQEIEARVTDGRAFPEEDKPFKAFIVAKGGLRRSRDGFTVTLAAGSIVNGEEAETLRAEGFVLEEVVCRMTTGQLGERRMEVVK